MATLQRQSNHDTQRLKSLLEQLSSMTKEETEVLEAFVDLSRRLRQE